MMRVTTYTKALLVFTVLAFLFVGFFGIGHANVAMHHTEDMQSGNCFVPGMTATPCHMSPLEHVATWQSMFIAIGSPNNILLLLTILAVLAVGAALLFLQKMSIDTFVCRVRCSLQRQPVFAFALHPLQEAFSSGILHPKLF